MTITLTWVGHATVVLDIDGVRLVADPLLRRHNGILRRRGDTPRDESWSGADAVLLSHLHHDHAEVGSLRLLAGVPVLTAPENAAWVTKKGLAGRGLGEDEWVPVGDAGDVTVRLVPAVHHSRPMPHRPNAANGHLVRADGPGGARVWAVGDTEHYPDMVHLPALAGGPVDVALVPVGGWGPRLSGGHLGPAQAARVCAEVGVGVAIPVPWGTLHAPGGRHLPRGPSSRAGAAFEAAAQREAPGTHVVVLRPGESWSSSDDA